jgi:hypothetical protein
VFRNLLVLPDGEVNDPAVFITPVPNYDVGETFMLGDGSQFRILDINTNMTDDQLEELYSRGMNGIWAVEPT